MREWRPLLWVLICVYVALAAIFIAVPEIDLWATEQVRIGPEGFLLRNHPFTIFFDNVVRRAGVAVLIGAMFAFVFSLFTRRAVLGVTRKRWAFLLVCIGVGPGLIVNLLFKETWGRARPTQITLFGGDHDFSAAFIPTDQCPGNCSFMSGDVATVAALLALTLTAGRWRVAATVIVVAATAVDSFARLAEGGHFLSDVVFAALTVALVTVVLRRVFFNRRWPLLDPPAGHGALACLVWRRRAGPRWAAPRDDDGASAG